MMVTGYYPEPNYVLASTASVSFLMIASFVHYMMSWHIHVPLSLGLVLSSVWFHTQKSYMSYLIDQLAIQAWALSVMYEAFLRGPISMGIVYIAVSYDILVFYIGWLGNCYAFDEDRTISTFFHATTHFSGILGSIILLLPRINPPLF